jgi:NTP pyrophosphatase (non-canonical NTP hydrolase)
MVIEETGEFLQAWNKRNRNKCTLEHYVSEMVDCYIMLSQMRYMYGDLFERLLSDKLEKIKRKIG